MSPKKPYLPNIEPLLQAGINPKTGLPEKISSTPCTLKADVKKFLRLIDEQDAVNRYVWYNIPCDLTSQELERLLYYKGQLAFFFDEGTEKFYFMPYALDGTIDFYGRYNRIHPIPMTAGEEKEESDKKEDSLTSYLSNLKLYPSYAVNFDQMSEEEIMKKCVLLHDYTKQLSQTIIARKNINEPILDVMAECVPMARTARILSTGITGVRVNDEDESRNVQDANRVLEDASLTGKGFIPIVGKIDLQNILPGVTAKGEEFMLAMQSLDNLRLSGYGIDNGGLFEKKSHILQSEADVNGGPVGLVLQDGLAIRQNFCNIANSIFGTSLWCEINENISGFDMNGDGIVYNRDEKGVNSGFEGESEDE